MARSHREAYRRLFGFAEQQQAFLTTEQARPLDSLRTHTPITCTKGTGSASTRVSTDRATDSRRNKNIPAILVLHYADPRVTGVQTAQGFKQTRPLRAILDLIQAATVKRNFIRQALRQAVGRGLITCQQIRNRQMSEPARQIVEEVLRRVA